MEYCFNNSRGTLTYAIGNEVIKGVFAFGSRYEGAESITLESNNIISTGINMIEVNLISQSLNIYSTEEANIKVEHNANRELRESEKLIISTKQDKLIIKSLRKIGINLPLRESVNVYIPKACSHDINVYMISGKTNIENIKLENLIIKKTSGSVVIEELEI